MAGQCARTGPRDRTLGLTRLEPAAPRVDRAQVWTDTVKRGDMLRQVRGNGSLVPEQIQYVQSDTDGRIERIFILPGAPVESDTVLMDLSNPELEQQAFDLEWQLKAAEAQLEKLLVQLESERLTQESTIASLRADHTMALLEAETDATLAKDGLVPDLTVRRSRARADELLQRLEVEMRRLAIRDPSDAAQRAVIEADLAKLAASLELKRRQVAALRVRAGVAGVLQQIGDRETLQVGQRISPGATLAKIVQPTRLKAEIRIAETQARDVQIDQRALVDTRNGVIPGRVSRVDPAVINGTVTVDIVLEGELPRGARPDLSVDGTIELERLEDVLYVGRPVHGQGDATIGLFKVLSGGEAVRVPVKLGRSSVSTIEVLEGLEAGDTVVLSDMSQWDEYSRIKLR
jgi:HlyD family secretion protein